MKRLTQTGPDGRPVIPDSCLTPTEQGAAGEAADKLAKLESMCEALKQEQTLLSEKMDSLRLEGKSRTCQFRELASQKLLNTNLITLLKSYDVF